MKLKQNACVVIELACRTSGNLAKGYIVVYIDKLGSGVTVRLFGPSELCATSGANLGRPLSSFLSPVVQNPRRGCRSVPNFCMGS
jgi:hypothetical protein